jgi:putative acetyltransferase
MNIRRAVPADSDALVDIWLRSVRATYSFYPRRAFSLSSPCDYLTSNEPELWVLCSDAGVVMGFMGCPVARWS